MLSCAAPAAAVMPPAQRAPAQWPAPAHRAAAHAAHLLHAPLKEEPIETCPDGGAFSKEHGSGFLSEGFHSASPSSSSKDSHGHSPRSDRGSPPYYEPPPPASEFGLQLHFRAGLPCSLLTPPGLAAPASDRRPRLSPYSPEPRAPPPHASTPLPAGRTPPQSPATGGGASSPDYFRDSGYHASQRFKCEPTSGGGSVGDDAEAREGSCDATDDGDFEEEPGLRVPAVNSHGKVKTFKCKQCEFVAVTKLSFWEHTKEHIKPEKMLTCPKCPFVTEYKHHLEYHMRNHFGSKPFQCGQCSYSCVNKSMLNSHLKSHSNVYQYRCADCNYATKYCHSLKLHLRKYRHNPAMVLNQDGTPNPLPIIDVYGTRRGPKQKPTSKSHDESQGPPPQPPHPLFHNPFAVNFPYSSLLPHPFLFSQNNNYGEAKSSDRCVSPGLVDPTLPPTILQQRLTYGELPPERPQRSPAVAAPSSPPRRSPQLSPPPLSPRTPPPPAPARVASRSPAEADDALDLTSGKHSDTSSPPPIERPVPLTPTAAMKSRRKGRAFKLQPAALRLQHEEPRPLDVEISGSESDASGGEVAPAPATTPPPPPPRPSPPASAAYDCPFCDISFKDLTMHTIHMGFHGYNDPYMCNKCGDRSADKVSFFIHLGRAEHA